MKKLKSFLITTIAVIGLAAFGVVYFFIWPALQVKKMWDGLPVTPSPSNNDDFNRMNQP